MKPDNSIIKTAPASHTARALIEPGKTWAIYLRPQMAARGAKEPASPPPARGTLTLDLELPAGRYRGEWINPVTGQTDKTEKLRHNGGTLRLESPPVTTDIALRLRRQ